MARTIKSMRGKEIDMEKLNLKNELLPAVGNAKVNARGDEIGKGGEIVELEKKYYKITTKRIQEQLKKKL